MALGVRAVGAVSAAVTASPVSIPRPSGVVAGDALYAVIEAGLATSATVTGWTELYRRSQVAAVGSTILIVIGKIAEVADESAGNQDFTLNGFGNHASGRMLAVQDHGMSTINDTVIGTGSGGAAGTSPQTDTISGITVTANSLILMIGSTARDASSTAEYSAWTNANFTSITEHMDNLTLTGNGGGFGVASGMCAGTSTGSSTYQRANAEAYNNVHIAIPPVVTNTFQQTHFRVRSDDSQGLNADAGWAAALDTNVTMDVEKKFRIRFEVQNGATATNNGFKLQYRKNGGTGATGIDWTDVPVVTTDTGPTNTEVAEIRPSDQFLNDAATTDILAGSASTFQAGVGSEDNATPAWNFANAHTELEWCLLIRKLYGTTATGSKGQNVDGDTFEFRVVSLGLGAFTLGYTLPTITVNVPDKLIGGTFVEWPGRIGPFKDGNGNLYTLVEFAETNPTLCIVKSTDGGNQWVAMDIANTPTRKDAEAVSIVQVGTELFILHQQSSNVSLHSFKTSDAATNPDTWNIKNEDVDLGLSTNSDQTASLVRRSDGTMIAFYESDVVSTFRQVSYRIRSTVPAWGAATRVDTTASAHFNHVVAVVGESDKTWIFYLDHTNGVLYYKTLSSTDVLSARTQVATGLATTGSTEHSIAAAVYFDDAGEENVVVVYLKSDNKLYCRWIREGVMDAELAITSETVAQNPAGTSLFGPVASATLSGKKLYVPYADSATSDIFYRTSNDGAAASAATEVVDAVSAEFLAANLYETASIGLVYDDGSGGYTGKIKFARIGLGQTIALGMVSEADTAQALAEQKKRALAQVSETSTPQAIAELKRRALAQVSEADTVTAFLRKKIRALLQASEVDTATVLTRVKRRSLSQPAETDTSFAMAELKRRLLGQSSETDIANAWTWSKRRTLLQAVETNIAQAIAKVQPILLNRTTQADIANAISRTIIRAVLQVTEFDATQGFFRGKADDLEQVIEDSIALQLQRIKSRLFAQASNVEIAQVLNEVKSRTIQATEADSALGLTLYKVGHLEQAIEDSAAQVWTGAKLLAMSMSPENDMAQAIVAAHSVALLTALEIDVVNALFKVKLRAFAQAIEDDLGVPILGVKFVPLELIAEDDLAQPLIGGKLLGFGQTLENNAAQPLDANKSWTLDTPEVAETASPITFSKRKEFAQSVETELPQSLTESKRDELAQVLEDDLAVALTELKRRYFGQIIETGIANALVVVKHRLLSTILETDIAHPLDGAKLRDLAQVLEMDLASTITHVAGRAIGQTLETDNPMVLSGRKVKTFGLASDTEISQQVAAQKLRTIAQALEVESAFPLGKRKSKELDIAFEADVARAMVGTKIIAMGLAQESDGATSLVILKTRELGKAVEFDISSNIDFVRIIPLNRAVENGAALGFTKLVTIVLHQAVEIDQAMEIVKGFYGRIVALVSTATPVATVKKAETLSVVASETGKAKVR